MPFVSKTRYAELQELKEQLKEERVEHNRELVKQADNYDERIEDMEHEHSRELAKQHRKDQANRDELADKNATLTEQNKALKEAAKSVVQREADVEKRELEADRRELEIEAATELTAEIEKKLEDRRQKLDADLEKAKDANYQKGYADGISDGLRKAGELSEKANDRVFQLAEKAVDKVNPEPVVVAPQVVTTPAQGSQKK